MTKKINPYNFVPLTSPVKRTSWTGVKQKEGHQGYQQETYTGVLKIRITCLTPLFIPSRATGDVVEKLCGCNPQCRRDSKKKKTYHKFFHRDGVPVIPGSTIKGLLRSTVEALVNGCLTLAQERYGSHIYKFPFSGSHLHENCNTHNGLCPSCSIFGVIHGEDCHFQGKLKISDALGDKQFLEQNQEGWILKPLAAPKPERHPPFYGIRKGYQLLPKGRKFYYHHIFDKDFDSRLTKNQHNHLNAKILERYKRDGKFIFLLNFENLSPTQLARIIRAVILSKDLAHKIGMGKPLGLGSIRMAVLLTSSQIYKSSARYEVWQPINLLTNEWLQALMKEHAPAITDLHLRDCLDLFRGEKGVIQYPEQSWFSDDSEGFDEWGYYDSLESERK